MYIIVKGKDEARKKLKGKTITEFSKNLESEGWPAEFTAEERDRIKFEEKQKRRPLQVEDAIKVKREMGIEINKKYIERTASKLRLEKFDKGYPGMVKDKKIITN